MTYFYTNFSDRCFLCSLKKVKQKQLAFSVTITNKKKWKERNSLSQIPCYYTRRIGIGQLENCLTSLMGSTFTMDKPVIIISYSFILYFCLFIFHCSGYNNYCQKGNPTCDKKISITKKVSEGLLVRSNKNCKLDTRYYQVCVMWYLS